MHDSSEDAQEKAAGRKDCVAEERRGREGGAKRARAGRGGEPCKRSNVPSSHTHSAHNAQARGAHNARDGVPIYAALDLGTNNCRLLVVRPSRRGFVVIDAFSRIIRLGEGLSRTGRLSDAAIERTIAALKVCSDKMVRRGVVRSRLITTQACRIADNGREFLDRVRGETGLELEIVSRETEARLAVSGCASLIDRDCDWALVFDIGGGSSELIWLELERWCGQHRHGFRDRLEVQRCIHAWTSLPVGVVTLAERYGGREVTPETFEAMVAHVTGLLEDFERKHAIGRRTASSTRHFLGTSGTVTTLAGVHLGLSRYDRSRVDGCWLGAEDVRAVTARLAGMSYEERASEPCIGAGRADMVVAGCAILEALMRMWPCDRLRVADRGLREGILATLMAEDRELRPSGPRQGGGGSGGRGGRRAAGSDGGDERGARPAKR